MDTKNVYQNIKKFRELKGLTREFVSGELDMSVSGYSKIERGEIDLSLSKLERISKIIGVSVSQIMNFDSKNIFNISNNENVQGVYSRKSRIYNCSDEITMNYIKLLEEKIKNLSQSN